MAGLKRIGLNVKEYRTRANMTQAELANMVGVSKEYISFVENAKKSASNELLMRIAKATGVTLSDLVKGA